jgi:hypothetical protein
MIYIGNDVLPLPHMTGAVFQRGHQLNTNRWPLNAQCTQFPRQVFPDATSYVSIPLVEHQSQADAIRFMNYLVLPYIGVTFQNVPKMDGMNGNSFAPSTAKVENIVIPAVDGQNTPEWLAARTGFGSQHHHISYLVADDGLSETKQTGE